MCAQLHHHTHTHNSFFFAPQLHTHCLAAFVFLFLFLYHFHFSLIRNYFWGYVKSIRLILPSDWKAFETHSLLAFMRINLANSNVSLFVCVLVLVLWRCLCVCGCGWAQSMVVVVVIVVVVVPAMRISSRPVFTIDLSQKLHIKNDETWLYLFCNDTGITDYMRKKYGILSKCGASIFSHRWQLNATATANGNWQYQQQQTNSK